MPKNVDEKKWEHAQKIAKDSGKKETEGDSYWAYVMGIYKKMTKNKKLSNLLHNLEKLAVVILDIKKGDTLLGGRFKNVPMTVKEISEDELGQPTVNGKKLLTHRIKKKLPQQNNS